MWKFKKIITIKINRLLVGSSNRQRREETMALSFKQSKQTIQEQSIVVPRVTSLDISSSRYLTESQIVVYSSDEFQISDKYAYYENYRDENMSHISCNKDINMNPSQINITQETNSQYIPFEMNRFHDGIDLMKMEISIHFVNANNKEYYSSPINVSYSDSKIQFGWLVDEYVTNLVGEVKFEIVAIGTNEKGDKYVWRTKPNGVLNIMESLTGDGVIDISLDVIHKEDIDKLFINKDK